MVFEMTRIDHIGIATGSIEKSSKFWNMLGFEDSGDEIVAVSYTHLTLPTTPYV